MADILEHPYAHRLPHKTSFSYGDGTVTIETIDEEPLTIAVASFLLDLAKADLITSVLDEIE